MLFSLLHETAAGIFGVAVISLEQIFRDLLKKVFLLRFRVHLDVIIEVFRESTAALYLFE
jgi:hypothetical protein